MIEMCNPNATNWLKLTRGQVLTKGINSLRNDIFSSEECDKLLNTFKQSKYDILQNPTSVTITTLQGRVLSFLLQPTMVKTNETLQDQANAGTQVDNRVDSCLVWIVNDITDLTKMMEEKQSAILRFMKCTSHDMRTPMQAISLASHSLNDGSSDVKGDINTIISSSAILGNIVSNILEFKEVSSTKLIPKLSPTDVKEI